MSDQEKDLADIQDIQIEALSDADLDSVAGGAAVTDICSGCPERSYCTNITIPPATNPGTVTPGTGG